MQDVTNKKADIEEEKKDEKLKLEKGKLSLFKIIISAVFVNLVISLSCVTAYHHYFAPQIVAMDLRGYVQEQRNLFLTNKITKEQLRKSLDKFETVVTNLPKTYIVLSRDAVIRNVEEVQIN